MTNATAPSRRRRSPGEGSVYRNGNRWRGALTWTNPDGTRERRIVSGSTAAETREKLDGLRRQAQLDPLPSSRATVGEYLSEWIELDRTNVRPWPWRSRETRVRIYLIPALGRVPLSKLTATDVDRALTRFSYPDVRLLAGVAGPTAQFLLTARHIRATLRLAHNEAIRKGLVVRNAASEAKAPKVRSIGPYRSGD